VNEHQDIGPQEKERPPKGGQSKAVVPQPPHQPRASLSARNPLRRRRAASWRLPCGEPWRYPPPGVRYPHVHVGGIQNADGSVRERWISITVDVDDLDASAARSLARQLAAAADQLEQVAFAEAVAGLRETEVVVG
jgi:hypothetical protein